jgi:hypothetical protein
MNLRDLLALYAVVGVACAIATLRRANSIRTRSVAAAVAMVAVWPFWAPFALATPPQRTTRAAPRPPGPGVLARIERALDEAVAAAADTPMSEVFSPKVAARIGAEAARVAARLEELDTLSARAGFDAEASARRVVELEARGAPELAVATARLQHGNLTRLVELRAADAQALEDLADLLEALRTQLLLARYSGSSADGAGAIVSEVWARLEGLGAAFEGSS